MPDKLLAVISVQGRDQKGVVAQFATFVADRGVNIEDLEQRVVSGVFVMDMLVDLKDMSVSLDELITGSLELGKKINMEVKVSLQRQPRSKRVVLLVSKEPHCLEKLLVIAGAAEFNGEIVGIFSNHPDLAPLAQKAGLPFDHKTSADKPAHMAWLLERLGAVQADLVVLARYMQILSPEIVAAYPSRIINIHPCCCRFFPGRRHTGRRLNPGHGSPAARHTLSPSSWIRGRSFCRMCFTSTSAQIPRRTSGSAASRLRRISWPKRCGSFWMKSWWW